jgi:hypothetical protein
MVQTVWAIRRPIADRQFQLAGPEMRVRLQRDVGSRLRIEPIVAA